MTSTRTRPLNEIELARSKKLCIAILGLFPAVLSIGAGCNDTDPPSSAAGNGGTSAIATANNGGTIAFVTGGSGGTTVGAHSGYGGNQAGGALASGGSGQATAGGPSKSEVLALCNQAVCDHLDHLCPTSHADCATNCAETVNIFNCTTALADYLNCLDKVTSATCLSDGTVQQEGLCPAEEAALSMPCEL